MNPPVFCLRQTSNYRFVKRNKLFNMQEFYKNRS